ncbi:MAG TPA: phosphoglycerate mutase family protein [Acidimicrobiales bacterium]|nr:phosphoglycerate mutase family protein [Acidimicrobiales bacterium]
MLVLLVRHGHAGSKRSWRGDDRLRPLDPVGLTQADALTALLVPYAPERIVSSPLLRCIQTVAPLAETLGFRIERSKQLVPDATAAAESLVRRVGKKEAGPIVLCTHGEVIRDFQLRLHKTQPDLFGRAPLREKGSVWVLERVGQKFVSARYLAPPAETDMAAGADTTDTDPT